jgi:hypothetical protein
MKMNSSGATTYEVENSDDRVGLLELLVNTPSLVSRIKAFYRQPPATLPDLNYFNGIVQQEEFGGVKALIIGGSRGLGELVAKMIVAGGGVVAITYNSGEQDAKKLHDELASKNQECSVVQLTVNEGFKIPEGNFNQVYYFATPKITADDNNSENLEKLEIYRMFYVLAFNQLCDQLIKSNQTYSVFYPSTIFVETEDKKFRSYALAKREGEELCLEISKNSRLNILQPRLPRLPTDQTLGIFKSKMTDPIEVMLKHVRLMTMGDLSKLQQVS